ncbi:hypothetical protein KL86PLE_40998 [uncultured Pleomorphomonas sp.]|uniref:Uncharacterized protein n=1 Tax=uncultured Pleomorphomonas sp. TaxID=442121 RepID=A0A212LI06_9HYPH|nr:hypothetical protein KL86PLE_40998 [uncultured Pleomorphomonas sp.]
MDIGGFLVFSPEPLIKTVYGLIVIKGASRQCA